MHHLRIVCFFIILRVCVHRVAPGNFMFLGFFFYYLNRISRFIHNRRTFCVCLVFGFVSILRNHLRKMEKFLSKFWFFCCWLSANILCVCSMKIFFMTFFFLLLKIFFKLFFQKLKNSLDLNNLLNVLIKITFIIIT